MMSKEYFITNYCSLRSRSVSEKGIVLFQGNELKPASFFTEVYKHFGFSYAKFYKMDSLCKLGYLASEILLKHREVNGENTGVILYNAASSLDTDRNHQQSISDRNAWFPSPSVFVYTLPNIVIGEICIRHKIFGEGGFFVTRKYEPLEVYEYVKYLLDENVMQTCITGWVEYDGDHYDCFMMLVQKSAAESEGFVIFDPQNIHEIYSH
jgi:hypothetical protein